MAEMGMMARSSEDNVKIRVENLTLDFGALHALVDVNIEVKEGEILAIIGPNGAGKTCLLNCISGYYHPQKGRIYFEGSPILGMPTHKRAEMGIARTFQKIELFTGLTTLGNLLAARHMHYKYGLLAGGLYFGPAHAEEIRHRRLVEEIIDFLEIEPIRDTTVAVLPYGLRKRVELGRALAMEPKVILLDEPMAGMNVEEKEDMSRFILDIFEGQANVDEYKSDVLRKGVNTVVLIEHDMGVVMDIADRIVVLDFGRKIAEGPPSVIRNDANVIKAYLGQED
jgi:branched-chain amino acid transport system ATP-binding protein